MKAAVLWGYNQPLSVEDVDLDPPKACEVRVKVGAAGVCRSDLHVMKGEAQIKLPAVLGHEGAGTVTAVGPGVTKVKPGDRVIFSFVAACGRCRSCLNGRSNLCDLHMTTGAFMLDGTTRLHKGDQRIHHMGKIAVFAQESVAPETSVYPIPADVPLEVAALIGCSTTTGVGAAIYSAHVTPGSTVAVFGVGGVGMSAVQGARVAGASRIIAVDPNEGQLEFAARFGATHTVNPKVQDPVKRIREITDGLGADFTFETFGASETSEMAVEAARKAGTVTIVGIVPIGDLAKIDMQALVRMEKTIRGCYYGSARPLTDFGAILDLYRAGKIDVAGMVTRRYRLDDINRAYHDLEHGGIGRGVITQF